MSRVAVVTGGASGMGVGISRHLSGAGHRVAVVDIDGDRAEQTAGELRNRGPTRLRSGQTCQTGPRSTRRSGRCGAGSGRLRSW